jgi:hypothetical protein
MYAALDESSVLMTRGGAMDDQRASAQKENGRLWSGREIGGGGGTAVFRLFRGGPDYAFILLPGCGACYPPRGGS